MEHIIPIVMCIICWTCGMLVGSMDKSTWKRLYEGLSSDNRHLYEKYLNMKSWAEYQKQRCTDAEAELKAIKGQEWYKEHGDIKAEDLFKTDEA